MMLVSGRVLYLYAMCREDDSGGAVGADVHEELEGCNPENSR
jgi:hypothetical protein